MNTEATRTCPVCGHTQPVWQRYGDTLFALCLIRYCAKCLHDYGYGQEGGA